MFLNHLGHFHTTRHPFFKLLPTRFPVPYQHPSNELERVSHYPWLLSDVTGRFIDPTIWPTRTDYMTLSYPPVVVEPCQWKKPIRAFLPIDPPVDLDNSSPPPPPPPLPCPPRAQPFSRFFSLSTHIVPAVYLRRGPCVPVPDLSILLKKKKDGDDEGVVKVRRELQRNARDPGIRAEKHENRRLWNVVNRYVNTALTTTTTTTNSNGLTLFFACAGGLPKEVSCMCVICLSLSVQGLSLDCVIRFGSLCLLVSFRPLLLWWFLRFGLGSRSNTVIRVLSMPKLLQDSVNTFFFFC